MDYCGLLCTSASFPGSDAVDGSRSCRTFVALYCSRKNMLVHKNLPCPDKREKAFAPHGAGRGRIPRS